MPECDGNSKIYKCETTNLEDMWMYFQSKKRKGNVYIWCDPLYRDNTLPMLATLHFSTQDRDIF